MLPLQFFKAAAADRPRIRRAAFSKAVASRTTVEKNARIEVSDTARR